VWAGPTGFIKEREGGGEFAGTAGDVQCKKPGAPNMNGRNASPGKRQAGNWAREKKNQQKRKLERFIAEGGS